MTHRLTGSASRRRATFALALLVCAFGGRHAAAQALVLRCDPTQTAADYTVDTTLHTVHGSFAAKGCEIQFDPASGKVGGEFVFDAASGHSGSEGRDHKMHKEVLESPRYPEISFRPDRVEGKVAAQGTSTVQVHGQFGIHGAEHEITVPVEIKMSAEQWSLTAQFPVPFLKWGMKNPSTFILRVSDSVEIHLRAGGSVVSAAN